MVVMVGVGGRCVSRVGDGDGLWSVGGRGRHAVTWYEEEGGCVGWGKEMDSRAESAERGAC